MVWKFSVPLAVLLSATQAVAAYNAPSKITIHGAPPPPSGTVSYTAVVDALGQLVRGAGATGASQQEDIGSYEVDFETDVTGCAYIATLGEPGNKGSIPASFITVVGRSGVANAIFVQTFARNGKLKALPFHVDVGC